MEETKQNRTPLTFTTVAEFTGEGTGAVVIVSKSDAHIPSYSVRLGTRPKGETIDKRIMPFIRVTAATNVADMVHALFKQAEAFIREQIAMDTAARPAPQARRPQQSSQPRRGDAPQKGLKELAKADRAKFLERQKNASLHNEEK
jgi:hypothetical protein